MSHLKNLKLQILAHIKQNMMGVFVKLGLATLHQVRILQIHPQVARSEVLTAVSKT